MSMIRYLAFHMQEVFPDEDPLSEWLVKLALAMNDLALVHVRFDEDQDEPDRAFYWNRLAVSHFTEAAVFLHDTADVLEVKTFVESLEPEARAKNELPFHLSRMPQQAFQHAEQSHASLVHASASSVVTRRA